MGEYTLFVNRCKKEILNPHVFGDSLTPYSVLQGNTIKALALVLMDTNRIRKNGFVGRWANDKIIIIGDEKIDGDNRNQQLYEEFHKYTDISLDVRQELEKFPFIELGIDWNEKATKKDEPIYKPR
jgi:hypothetical protein